MTLIEAYQRAAEVAVNSDIPEEKMVGEIITRVIEAAIADKRLVKDSMIRSLRAIETATQRIRNELKAIHS